jgi:hypothetical protein
MWGILAFSRPALCDFELDLVQTQMTQKPFLREEEGMRASDRLFPKMGECREVLGGGPAPPSKL